MSIKTGLDVSVATTAISTPLWWDQLVYYFTSSYDMVMMLGGIILLAVRIWAAYYEQRHEWLKRKIEEKHIFDKLSEMKDGSNDMET